MIWLLLTIALWGLVHSWLASIPVKEAIRRALGSQAARIYRLAYNVFAVLSFAPILLLVAFDPGPLLYSARPPWLYIMLMGQGAAVVCLGITLLETGAAAFLGLRQLVEGDQPPRLVTQGFYRWIRHPLYLFGFIILWLTPRMTLNMLVGYASLSAYLVIGAMFEERKLRREFGEEYTAYRERTPMFLPLASRRRL